MKSSEIQVFINLIEKYFSGISEIPCSTGIPRVASAIDYRGRELTGLIGISGDTRGCVYFSADRPMVREVLHAVVGESADHGNAMQDPEADMIGEIANTIAGNAMDAFGDGFLISVPVVLHDATKIALPKDIEIVVIPISWSNHQADLVMGLE